MALRAAGLALPTDRVLDGKEPTAALTGRSDSPHRYLYWQWGKAGAAIRRGRYKLVREQDSPQQDWQLFDLQADLGETTDLRAAKPDVAGQLQAEYERWQAEVTSRR